VHEFRLRPVDNRSRDRVVDDAAEFDAAQPERGTVLFPE